MSAADSSQSIVSCPNCSTKNRVPAQSKVSKCGKCGALLGATEQVVDATVQAVSVNAKNPFAITGLVLGLTSVFLGFLMLIPILGIVFSGIGLSKVNQYGGRGKMQAWVGLVLSGLYLLVSLRDHGYILQN